MRIYDACAGAFEHTGFSPDMRFSVLGLVFAQESRWHADTAGEVVHFLQGLHLRVVLGYDPFSRVAVGNAVLGAEFVQQRFTSQTQFGLERRRAVVESGVYDFAVS